MAPPNRVPTEPALPPAARWLLRLLWPADWTLLPLPPSDVPEADQRPVIRWPGAEAPATLYLPPTATTDWVAMVAHAAAHRRFGGPPQPRKGLKPVQQALLGVLEDARVEWLAAAEWPGLRAWWRPHHPQDPALQGQGFDDLLARLSAALLDPAWADPHPWIARVRQVFFERDGRTLALRTPQAVREAASRLGHDIGQMRLPFNARTYRVHARYRDDNHHLWLPSEEDREALTLPDLLDSSEADAPPPPPSPAQWQLGEPVARYPEWDLRLGRYRPDWVTVYEHHWPSLADAPGPDSATVRQLVHQARRRRHAFGRGHQRDVAGDDLHPQAVIDHAVARRARLPPDPRVWRRPAPRREAQGVLLLVDASVSTAAELRAWQQQVQQAAWALQRLGQTSAVWAFGSDGRHRVRLQRLKDWDERCESVPWGCLQPGGSTRLGAALRHAAHLCAQGMRAHALAGCTVLLLTDGELHDIDVHHSGHLEADLQQALRELHGRGIRVQALVPVPSLPLRRALGAAACHRMAPGVWGAALARALSAGAG
ncbi:MAG: VWA domain-containing protein [Hydrogenophaga sp.]|nr:VWA domain-containing protein [Hydrogenophaga sp.]